MNGHLFVKLQILLLAFALQASTSGMMQGAPGEPLDIAITTDADSGEGSLRAALTLAADNTDRPVRISFGERTGPFSEPRTIELSSALPPITGDVTIDGFIDGLLWKAYGLTISGGGEHRIFEVLPGATLRIQGLTLRDGQAFSGGAIANHGRLVVDGCSLLDNAAEAGGGALVNFGRADIVNSTLAWNRAGFGGAIAVEGGEVRLVHATLYENVAVDGASVQSAAGLHIANSILAGPAAQQCRHTGKSEMSGTYNLIQGAHDGCGNPILEEDPELRSLGYYNGPTPTIPLDGSSPALNLALAESAVGPDGARLQWDQRGNGDPRFASGYADLGAFERQTQLPSEFVVDTQVDTGLRGCTRVGRQNCPLRAALELSAAARHPTPVRFDPDVFRQGSVLRLDMPPRGTRVPIVIDGSGAPGITIELATEENVPWSGINGVQIVTAYAEPGDAP
ncbi:MAG: choice-of-anchor Q domain-containing protein [Candidatus Wenzhouxiangella sp. M2_3B_020]